MKKVVISDRLPEEAVAILEGERDLEVVNRPGLAGADLVAALGDAEGLIVRSDTQVTAEVLERAPKLRAVVRDDHPVFLESLQDSLCVLREPGDFLLQEGKCLGYRPVHHTLIGSLYDKPLNTFWRSIYHFCQVPDDRVFPMTTHVDNETLRPYFNAGCLITRPEKHLLRNWRDAFITIYEEPPFPELFLQDKRYEIFLHQAVLSGVILSTLVTDEIIELPITYNYPLHLFEEDITDNRPSSLDELVTIRHEGFYEDPEWFKKMPAKEPLKKWIAERLL